MDLPEHLHRRDGGSSSGGLGLGWILAIALCGGVLLFACVGYLLVWRIRVRMQPCTTRVYVGRDQENPARDGDDDDGDEAALRRGTVSSSFTNVLSKTRLLRSESSLSKLSSGISMTNLSVWRPPVLPPLPTNDSGFLEGERRRWQAGEDDGEVDHGSATKRRSWRDNWVVTMALGAPSQSDLARAMEKGDAGQKGNETIEEVSGPKQAPGERPRNEIHVQKKRLGRPTLKTSQTAPELLMQDGDEPSRGRSRFAGPMQRWAQQQQLQAPKQPAPTHQPAMKQQSQQQQQDQYQLQQNRHQLQQQYLYQHRVRGWATETDLRDILMSTEQRLRDGTSRSPVKTPRSSPAKTRASPTKTPRGCATGSSTKTAGRLTPSPSKMNLLAGSPTAANVDNRNVSASSASSAADSLIRVATEELDLPGGLSSPSRHHQQEWDAPPRYDLRQKQEHQQQQVQQHPRKQHQQPPQRRRSNSLESHASSCLSTLYSVGEPEEEDEVEGGKTLAAQYDDDPFVETRRIHQQQLLFKKSSAETWQQQQQELTGPRPLRRTQTVGGGSFSGEIVDESAIPAPLRTMSVNSHLGRTSRQGSDKRNSRLSLVLQPPQWTQSEDVKPKTSSLLVVPKRMSLTEAPSETSIVSDSAYTDVSVGDSVGDSSEETIKLAVDVPAHRRVGSSVSSATTATNNGWSWHLSSTTPSEREVLSMLRQAGQPKRDLPVPPFQITLNDDTLMPAPLSPKAKNQQHSSTVSKRVSTISNSSSNYSLNSAGEDGDKDTDAKADLPSRRITSSGGLGGAFLGAAHSVGNTVAELRRMNSFVSSYSAASMASFFGETLAESSTLTSLRGGGFSPTTDDAATEAAGKRNYLNLGRRSLSPAKEKRKRSSMVEPQVKREQPPPRPRSGHARTQSRWSIPVLRDIKDHDGGKENRAPNPRTVRFDIPSGPGLRGGHPIVNLPPPTSTSPTRNTRGMTPVQVKRSSADSLGLYDKDGFLKSSPERDAAAKAGRLRM